MIEHKVDIRIPKNRTISYNQYRDWCIKVGFGEWEPEFCSNGSAARYTLRMAHLPEDLAILFRLEFNV